MKGQTPVLDYAEADWARSVRLPTIDQAWLNERLGHWPELLGKPWSVLGGGLRSLNIRVEDFVARIALQDAGEDVLRKQIAAIKRVQHEVSVPEVVDQTKDAVLMRWVEHQPLTARESVAHQVGEAAAKIHAHRYGSGGMLGPDLGLAEPFADTWAWLRDWSSGLLAGPAGSLLGAKGTAIQQLWDQHDGVLREACTDACFLHADFKPANIKQTASGGIIVFDWEFCCAGPALFDLGQMLRWGVPDSFLRGFTLGYEAGGGVLPRGWRRTAALIDLVNLIAFLDRVPADSKCRRDVERRIDQTLVAG